MRSVITLVAIKSRLRRLRGDEPAPARKRIAILVTSDFGQPSVEEIDRQAGAGERPRRDYAELARVLDADVIDGAYMTHRATPIARLVARRVNLAAGQVVEGFVRRRRYSVMVAWADRIGLPLALLLKIARSRQHLVLISIRITNGVKAFLVKRLRVYSHLDAIFARNLQLQLAAEELGVPDEKLRSDGPALDELFWTPIPREPENMICAVGWEARDYQTLIEAVRDLPVTVEIAAGTITLPELLDVSGTVDAGLVKSTGELPSNVHLRTYKAPELRALYARSRFVVVPVHQVDFDAGATAITEAMGMARAVITSRVPALTGQFRDGEAGMYVEPGDVAGWRASIQYLLDHPDEAARMGQTGRALVDRVHRLDDGTVRFAEFIRGLTAECPSTAALGSAVLSG
jgi:glycosyltransferase involved in cell wall biosynthesis